MYIKIDKNMYT